MRCSDLGDRLYAARNAQGMSQRGVASKAGVSPSTVSQMEAKAWDPTVSTTEKVAEAVGCDPGWLAFGKKPAGVPQGSIAERLKLKRAELGLTTRELADLSKGVSQTAISQIERGSTSNPGILTVTLLANALAVDPCWLACSEH